MVEVTVDNGVKMTTGIAGVLETSFESISHFLTGCIQVGEQIVDPDRK